LERDLRLFAPDDRATDAMRARGRFDEAEVRGFLDIVRFGSSPGSLEALHRMNRDIDIRHVLPAVRVPTLVLHASEDTVVPRDVARYIASRIPAARVVEIAGAGHLALGERALAIVDEIETVLAEVWDAGGWEEAEPERVLATVRSCSPTSSVRRRRRPSWVIGPGGSFSNAITL
jgi:pimeloyl-ACP methyl ester carboxylesterase